MRDILTIIAGLIVLVLCAALAVPYFVDWDARRGDVELALSRALGLPVITQGDINLRLLPSPRVILGRVTIGTPAAGRPGITANELSVELETTALLSGAVRVVEARLVRPVVTAVVGDDGRVMLPELSNSIPMPITAFGIEKLVVDAGQLRLIEAEGGVRDIGPISGEIQAVALSGPWRIAGQVGNIPLRLSTGTIDAEGRLRVKGGIGELTSPHLDIDGDLLLTTATPAGGGSRAFAPGFNGRLGAVIPLPQADTARADAAQDAAQPPSALMVTATVTTAGRRLKAETVEVTTANGGSSLALAGTGELDFGRSGPVLSMALTSRRLEITQGTDLAGRVGEIGERLVTTLPSLKASIGVQAASFAIAGEEFGPLDLAVGRENGKATVERFNLAGAGDARLEASGSVDFGTETAFSGRVAFGIREPARLALSLGRIGLSRPLIEAISALPASRAVADLSMSSAVLAARNIRFTAGDATLSGLFRYTPPTGAERARFDAQLAGKGLDLANIPLLDAGVGGLTGADLGLSIDLEAPRFGTIASPGGRLKARVTRDAEALTIASAEMTNVDGANMKLAGRIGRDGGQIDGGLTAPRPAVIAALAARFLPPSFAETLQRVAPLAAPLTLALKAERRDASAPVLATLEGQGGGTAFRTALSLPAPGAGQTAQGSDASVWMELTARDGVDLLRQLGVDVVPLPGLGEGRLIFDAKGRTLADLAGTAELRVAGATLSLAGRLGGTGQAGDPPPLAQGKVKLATDDLAPLAQVLARSFPGLLPGTGAHLEADGQLSAQGVVFTGLKGEVAGAPVEGRLAINETGQIDGTLRVPRLRLTDLTALALGPVSPPTRGQIWSSQRFVPAMPPVAGKVELGFGRLDVIEGITLADGKLGLDLTSDAITLRDVSGGFGGGSVLANVKLQRQGTLAAATGNVALKDVEASALFGKGPGGRLSGRMEAGSSGESVAALVANMSGGGELRSVGSLIARLDPAGIARGLGKLMAQDPIRAEATVVRDTIARELDLANWPLTEVVMPLTLSGGTLRFGPVTIDSRDVQLRLAGSVELGSLTLDARGLMVSRQLPVGWSGAAPEIAVSWRGPLTDPGRSVEAAALANGLAVIALARELDRIDKLEADAKERAERIRQLRLERERLAAEKRAAEQRDNQERNSQERNGLDGGGLDPATTGGTNNLPSQAPLPPAAPPPVSPRSEIPTIVPSFAGDENTAIGEGDGAPQERASLSSHGVRPAQPARVPAPTAMGLSIPTGAQPSPRARTGAPLDLTPPGYAPLR
ncbi:MULTISPECIES: AsmA family protein [unclassified Chelatococcus]|uniref:AsmA family protein n=1 Tax=unclassified Chelatococcus TaxID=2638111 RepID=UPI001BCA7352|nr:AsmA family protein [Chelatococcus sp.]MBS7737878.1 AsmA family protein [Chelatococcus sp. HY11]CAH1666632.1 conserved hypothetical protein [Hyphomicrobiales bacterium]MBX3546674.1 AsmA family protein [Chelatococcus sp.]MCO5079332.1 AsmA family protein [Chelatococcus sp.]CAH1680428.1 conserved hypothetical protein [Hyphomicrobiales bacterium]